MKARPFLLGLKIDSHIFQCDAVYVYPVPILVVCVENELELCEYTGWPKNWHHLLYVLTLPNINRFSKV